MSLSQFFQSAAGFIDRYREAVESDENKDIELRAFVPDPSEPFYYAQQCYEATLVFAFALNKTIDGEHEHTQSCIHHQV